MKRPRAGDGAGLEAVASLVANRTGLSFPRSRWSVAEAGMRRVQKQAGIDTVGAYVEVLRSDERAFERLVDELTVGETYFFRDPGQWEFVEREVVPAAISRGGSLRAWSAGCASGEEPYTLAILLDRLGHLERATLSGTDIARARLARARRGLYGRWSLRSCPDPIVDAYFERSRAGYRLIPSIREAVDFGYLNLGEPEFLKRRPDLRRLDLVMCRNVLIYLDPDTIARVARGLLDALHDDGWLLLGASDPPLHELVPCRVTLTDAGLAYQRAAARPRAVRELVRETPPAGSAGTGHAGGDAGASEVTPRRAARRDRPGLRPPRPMPALRPRAKRASAGSAAPAPTPDWREPADEAACVAAVRELLNAGRLAESEAALRAALERHPGSAELAYLRAVLLSEMGRDGEAVRAARDALYLDRGMVVAHLALAGALDATGDRPGAERALRNAERSLAELPADSVVPRADGVLAADLLALVRARARTLNGGAA